MIRANTIFTHVESKVASMMFSIEQILCGKAEKHGLLFLETQSNRFMVVSKIRQDQSKESEREHAKNIFAFSSEVIQDVSRVLIDPDDPSIGTCSLRIGLHSGRVVADMVGHSNPSFSLLGDTVYIAVRMAQASNINQINCSEETTQLLRIQYPDLEFYERGHIHVRGKGHMRCSYAAVKTKALPSDAADRVRVKQRFKLLKSTVDAAHQEVPDESIAHGESRNEP